jgi:RNA polymerase sigma factor (sigma-70 family)
MAIGSIGKVVQHLRQAILRGEVADLTDDQLLECFVAHHEEAAFAALVRRHSGLVWGVCLRVLGHHQAAEDAFQATFLVLLKKAAAIRSARLLASWLYGVAYRTALKAKAVAARLRTREKQVTVMPEPEVSPDPTAPSWQPLLDRELSQLAEKYRVPIVLCDLQGKTRKEAAQQLGCPEGTVAGRLARARVLLARRLSRHGLAMSAATLAVTLPATAASASVPATLLASTLKASAAMAAAGSAGGAALVSTEVAALTQAVLKGMALARLKLAVLVLLTVALAGGGAALVVTNTGRQGAEAQSAPTPMAGPSQDTVPPDGATSPAQANEPTAGAADEPRPEIADEPPPPPHKGPPPRGKGKGPKGKRPPPDGEAPFRGKAPFGFDKGPPGKFGPFGEPGFPRGDGPDGDDCPEPKGKRGGKGPPDKGPPRADGERSPPFKGKPPHPEDDVLNIPSAPRWHWPATLAEVHR